MEKTQELNTSPFLLLTQHLRLQKINPFQPSNPHFRTQKLLPAAQILTFLSPPIQFLLK